MNISLGKHTLSLLAVLLLTVFVRVADAQEPPLSEVDAGQTEEESQTEEEANQPRETGHSTEQSESPGRVGAAVDEQQLTRRERRLINREREMPGNQKIGWERRRQVPFVRGGGMINRKENALVFYADGQLWPPALMVSIQRGIYYWLTLGVDIGGDYGIFQAMVRIKQEMSRTRLTNFFFWGWHIRTGFKYVNIDFTSTNEDLLFEDTSWILAFENTFAFRFGRHRRRAVYISTEVYADFDLTGQGRQTDAYISPATLGFETILGRNWNFFIELGVIISLNGWETSQGVISDDGDFFPVGFMGFSYRWGGVRTALPENWRDPTSLPIR